jgi:4-hydroxyacetophenone monooxygenase
MINTGRKKSDQRESGEGIIDVQKIKQYIKDADPNILRLTLLQLTQDASLKKMRVEETSLWGGAMVTYSLAPEHHEEIRTKALEYFIKTLPISPPAQPDRDLVKDTMEQFGQGPLSPVEYMAAYEQLSIDDFPRDVTWNMKPDKDILGAKSVLIVGAGVCGIAVAIQMERLGIPYRIIDRQSDLGGTWHINDYPEARVDVSSQIYQYTFEKRYPWTEFFARAAETKRYLHHCAGKYGVIEKITYRTEVLGAAWDDAAHRWVVRIRTEGRAEASIEADFLISAAGLFNKPKLPNIPGIGDFAGEIFHTTEWNHSVDFAGKRVAQIGTGSTGVQFAQHVANRASHLTIYQRTANWVLEMKGYRDSVPQGLRWMFENFPFYWNWHNYGTYFANAQLELLHDMDPEWQRAGGVISKRNDSLKASAESYIRRRLTDKPQLIDKVIPRFPPLARRPTIDNGWYDTLLRDNVDLVTDPIEQITSAGIRLRNGEQSDFDVIICAAGFETLRYLWPAEYKGRKGLTPNALWSHDGPRAHLGGITMPGFPNFFMLYGPNSQPRSGSFHTIAEAWVRYIAKAIVRVIEANQHTIECKEESFRDYNRRLDEATKSLLWEKFGKGFYYLTKEGRSVVNVPWRTPDYLHRLREPNWDEFHFA